MAGPAAGGMNRLMILLPMIFLMGKVDWEDPRVLPAARAAFYGVQIIQLFLAFYIRQKVQAQRDMRAIRVQLPKSPMAPPDAATERSETTYYEHELSQTSAFLKQLGLNAAITSFIHFKLGVNQVLLLQSVMAPLNVYDNALFKKYIFGSQNERVWNELLPGEAEPAPAGSGSSTTTPTAKLTAEAQGSKQKTGKKNNIKDLSALISKCWDDAENADFSDAVTLALKTNPNATTGDDKWSLLMVASGSPVDTTGAIAKLIDGGADPALVDKDGWCCLHWAAFHDRPEAAQAAIDATAEKFGWEKVTELLELESGQDQTPEQVAIAEGNQALAKLLKSAAKSAREFVTSANEVHADGVRQRKGAAGSEEDDEIDIPAID